MTRHRNTLSCFSCSSCHSHKTSLSPCSHKNTPKPHPIYANFRNVRRIFSIRNILRNYGSGTKNGTVTPAKLFVLSFLGKQATSPDRKRSRKTRFWSSSRNSRKIQTKSKQNPKCDSGAHFQIQIKIQTKSKQNPNKIQNVDSGAPFRFHKNPNKIQTKSK